MVPRPDSCVRGILRWLRAAWLLFLVAPLAQAQTNDTPLSLVGSEVCAGCHQAQHTAWQQSHHAQAMQPATPATVLGDFNDTRVDHFGVATTFAREGDRFVIRTQAPDQTAQSHDVAYTFGVFPLQQYLIPMPGGRLQAFGIAWDSRAKAAGGQRWFPLYPDQDLKAGDNLHWTGRDQTWNRMCADCHSTGLRKNHDLASNTYRTHWAEVNVACETCHGRGSQHVEWAKGERRPDLPAAVRKGLEAWLAAERRWEMNPETGIARLMTPRSSAELDTCGGCHSRRITLSPDMTAGAPFLNNHMPALLDPGLYHADGQIDGEVFEYGSFLQSRMHRAGVTCSDCHAPHGASLVAPGDAVCAQCHAPSRFEAVSHHHHDPASAGARCVSCHMGSKVYMGVDRRHDHSFRVPRPDLSVAIGVPNTCSDCHTDKPAAWAAQAIAVWYPNGQQTRPHFGLALHAGRVGSVDAARRLDALIRDRSQPAITRATALGLLGSYFTAAAGGAVRAGANDADPLVRMAAPRAFSLGVPPAMVPVLLPLLSDPIRAVRIEAARALTGTDLSAVNASYRQAFAAAFQELTVAELLDGDLPEVHLNLGMLSVRRRDFVAAEERYRAALRLDPAYVPGLLNLADLERVRGRDAQSMALIRQALVREPESADARHALGLALVRGGDRVGALAELRRASALAPDNARYAYVHAIALSDSGSKDDAIRLLEQAHRRHPANREVLAALATLSRDAGRLDDAIGHAQALLALDPSAAEYRALVSQLRGRAAAGGSGR